MFVVLVHVYWLSTKLPSSVTIQGPGGADVVSGAHIERARGLVLTDGVLVEKTVLRCPARSWLLRMDWSLANHVQESTELTTADKNNYVVVGRFPVALHEGEEEVPRSYVDVPSVRPTKNRTCFRISARTRSAMERHPHVWVVAQNMGDFLTRIAYSGNAR